MGSFFEICILKYIKIPGEWCNVTGTLWEFWNCSISSVRIGITRSGWIWISWIIRLLFRLYRKPKSRCAYYHSLNMQACVIVSNFVVLPLNPHSFSETVFWSLITSRINFISIVLFVLTITLGLSYPNVSVLKNKNNPVCLLRRYKHTLYQLLFDVLY
jgi:hypothetical protein